MRHECRGTSVYSIQYQGVENFHYWLITLHLSSHVKSDCIKSLHVKYTKSDSTHAKYILIAWVETHFAYFTWSDFTWDARCEVLSHQGIFSLLDICFFALINSLKGMSLTSDNIFAKGAVDRHPNVYFNSKYCCLWLIQSILSSIFSVWTTYTEMRISNTSSSLFNMMEK